MLHPQVREAVLDFSQWATPYQLEVLKVGCMERLVVQGSG
jgi:hypothetical protein